MHIPKYSKWSEPFMVETLWVNTGRTTNKRVQERTCKKCNRIKRRTIKS